MSGLALMFAYLYDRLVGDPPWLPHPVAGIGRLAQSLERWLRPRRPGPLRELVGGLVLLLVTVATTVAVVYLLLAAARSFHPWAAAALEACLVGIALAGRSLGEAGRAVARCLDDGDLEGARRAVAQLVSRDATRLGPDEVVRAAVESVAENTSDGFVAPLFYALIGGAPLAWAYKAVNTLDAMYGYRDRSNLYFGRAAARADDVLNWLPARLTAVLIAVAAAFGGLAGRRAWLTAWSQGRRHPSPNAGYPEAAMAGALGVQLGGTNIYAAGVSRRPYLGEPWRPLVPGRVYEAVRVLELTALVATIIAALVALGFGRM